MTANEIAPEEVQKVLDNLAAAGGSHTIEYEDFSVTVGVRRIEEAIGLVRGSAAKGSLPRIMGSVNAALRRGTKRMRSGRATQKEADDYVADLIIWFANEVVNGRASLAKH